jgi:hypothetical protein
MEQKAVLIPIEKNEENIARITTQLFSEIRFTKVGPVFQGILEGRLAGYTPGNCPHPLDRAVVTSEFEYVCGQCGYQGILG